MNRMVIKPIQTGKETFTIAEGTSTSLKPGIVKVKGIVQDEEDGNLTNKWKLNITQVY